VHNFKMSAAFRDLFDAFENGTQRGPANGTVKILAVSLQVDLDCVKNPAQFRERIFVDESTADHHGSDILSSGLSGDINHIFGENSRFIVCKGDNRRFAVFCGISNPGRMCEWPLMVFGGCLRYLPVLAEFAAEWTAGGRKRK